MEDADGRQYVDHHAAFGPIVLGHNDPDVNQSVVEALAGPDLMGVGTTESEVELAMKLNRHIPSAEKVLLCNSGFGSDVQRNPAGSRSSPGVRRSSSFRAVITAGMTISA